jgi:LCP family protein required for cell wall assembly
VLPPSGAPRRRRRRLLRTVVLLVLLAVLAYPFAVAATAWRSLTRTAVLSGGIAATPGRTYLVVGSDSRKGLTKAQQRELHTGGDTFGKRTDTIMLLHVPAAGGPTVLMSVPRDSYLPIPGHGSNKVNAAYSFGGAKLLARTLEGATGVQIDDYVEIGFGGFATMVDAVGGVQICPKRAMNDKNAGINLKKGCQQADGKVALGYARARYSDPRGDLGRVERQREVLAAIVGKASAPSTLVNPFRTFPLARAGGSSLTVDDQMGQVALARFLLGMKSSAGSGGVSLTVPVTGTARRSGAGSVVLWDDAKAATVFDALKRSDTTPITAIAAEQKAAA